MFLLRLVVSTSRQIEIENVLRVETNFFKLSRFSRRSRSTFFFSRSRFLKSRFFSRDFNASRFLSRLLRRVEIVEICRDLSRHVEIFEICRDTVEICRDAVEICWEISTLSRPKVSTDWEISTWKCKNPRTSRSRSRQTVKKRQKFQTKSRFLDLDRDISIVETNFLKLLRFSRPSRLTFFRCRDRESRSRPRRDKLRPPTLVFID